MVTMPDWTRAQVGRIGARGWRWHLQTPTADRHFVYCLRFYVQRRGTTTSIKKLEPPLISLIGRVFPRLRRDPLSVKRRLWPWSVAFVALLNVL